MKQKSVIKMVILFLILGFLLVGFYLFLGFLWADAVTKGAKGVIKANDNYLIENLNPIDTIERILLQTMDSIE